MLGVDWEFSCCRNRLSKIHWFLRCLKMTLRNFKTLKRFQSLWPCLPPFLGLSTGCWDGARQKQETMCPLTLATSDSPCYDSSWAWIFCPEFWQNSGKGSRFYDGDRVFFSEKTCGGRKRGGANLEILVLPVDVPAKRQSCIQSHGDLKVTKCSSFLRCSHFWGNCQKYNTQAERLACRATATTYCNAKFLDFLKLARVFSLRKFWGVRRATGFQHVFLLWA